jgi:general secretion pathway protein A
LGELLAQPNLRQFSQRISVRYHLQPMDQEDTCAYIRHRLSVAGSEKDIFTQTACKSLYKFSRGLPRLINILCDRALLTAYSEDRHQVNHKDTQKAFKELLRKPLGSAHKLSWLVASAVTCGLILLLFLSYTHPAFQPQMVKSSQANAAPAQTVDYSDSVRTIRQSLAQIEEGQSFAGTVRDLMKSWRIETISMAKRPAEMANYLQNLPDSGWQWTSYSGDLQTLLRLDVPIILELSLPAVSGRRYIAVKSLSSDSVKVSLTDEIQQNVSVNVLSSLYTGRAYVVWKNYLNLSSFSQLGQRDLDISQIQNMLLQAGYYTGPITGIYDSSTIESVTRLQADRGVIQDGRIGPLTMMLLYQQGGTFNSPRLVSRNSGDPS